MRLEGLVAAPYAPLDANGDLDLAGVSRQAAWLTHHGVIGAFVNGTTGEGMSLTQDERMALAEAWLDVAGPDLRVIVHVGHNSLREAQRLAEHAAQHNAFAVAAMPPSLLRPSTVATLVDVCQDIAAAAGATPFYYYHIPILTNVLLPMPAFLAQAAQRIDNFHGIKFTHDNLLEYRQCLVFDGGRFDILFGRDELLLAALANGARGAVGSTYNHSAPLYHELIAAFERHDLEAVGGLADHIAELIDLIRAVGEIAAGKALMELQGVPVGQPRLPLTPLTPANARRVEQYLNARMQSEPFRPARSGNLDVVAKV